MRRERPFPRWLILTLGAATIALITGGVAFYRAQAREQQRRVETELLAIAELKADQIARWRAEQLADAAVIAQGPFLTGSARRCLVDTDASECGPARERLRSFQRYYGYRDVLLVDATGRTHISLAGDERPPSPELTAALAEAFRARQPVLTDLYTAPPNASIRLDVVTPIFGPEEAAEPVGAVVLRADVEQHLYPLIQTWPTPSGSAESLLVRRDGDEVVFLNELRHQTGAALTLRIPLSRIDVPAVQAVLGRTGVLTGRDYRGVPVLSVLKPVPNSDWFLIAKVDTAEAFATWHAITALILAVIVLVLGGAATSVGFIWQRHEKAYYQALAESKSALSASESRYRQLFEAAKDGVLILAGDTGAILDVNPYLAELLGCAREHLLGKRLCELGLLEDPTSDPARLAGRLPAGVVHHEDLPLRTPDGRRLIVESVSHPDQIGGHHIIQCHIREVTARRQAERERETLIELLRLMSMHMDVPALLRAAITYLQSATGCEAVGIRLREGEDFPYFETRGFGAEFVELEKYLCARNEQGEVVRDATGSPLLECMCGNILCGRVDPSKPFFTGHGSFWSNCTTELLATTTDGDRQTRTRNRCNGEGYESVALVPLRVGETTLGLLQFNDRRRDRFTPETIAVLERFADHLAVGLAHRQAQVALQTSEALYRSLFENTLNACAYCQVHFDRRGQGVDYTYLSVNSAFERLTGLHNVTGKRVSEVIPQIRETDAGLLAQYGRIAATGAPERFEYFVQALQEWVSVSAFSPRRGYFVSIFDVITERKRAEQTLRESEERYRTVANFTYDWEYWLGPEGELRYCSPACERLTGYRVEDLERDPGLLTAMIHPEDRPAMLAHMAQTPNARAETEELEYRIQTCSGEERWIAHACRVVHGENGEYLGRRSSNRDITERKQMEAELREALLRQQAAVQAGNVGLWDWDLQSHKVHYSSEWKRQIGYADDEISDEFAEWQDRVHPDDLPGTLERVRALVAAGFGQLQIEYRLRHKDGSYRWILSRAAVLQDASGKAVRALGTHIDLTDRKRIELELQRSARLLAQAERIGQTGSWDYDVVTDEANWSENMWRILDRDPADPREHQLQHFLAHVVHPDDRARLTAAYAEAAAGRRLYDVEYRVVRRDGGVRQIHARGEFGRDADGRPLRMFGQIEDITDRKLAEAERERLSAAIAQTGEAVIVTAADGTIQYVNPAFERVTGYTSADVLGQTPRVLKSGVQEAAFYAGLWHTISRGASWEGRLVNKRKDGTLFTESATISPVFDGTGNITNYVAVKRDITQELKIEEHLRQAQKIEEVGRLAGGVAHDLNNTLTAIFGYLDLARTQLPPDHEVLSTLGGLEHAAQQAAGVTRGLLTFSGRTSPTKQNIDLGKLLLETARMLRHMLPAGIEMETHVPPEAQLAVHADATQLQQVLVNLAVNARDAMPDGGHLELALTEVPEMTSDGSLAASARWARIVVRDTGTGMPREILTRIFDPFFTTKARGQGTGLGLAIVHGIIHDHDGRIEVDSTPGRGTTFTVLLPTVAQEVADAARAWIEPIPAGQKARILLAEDQTHVRRILASGLEAIGYEVVQVADGVELEQRVRQEARSWRLRILDVGLPRRNGVVCLRELRGAGICTPAILITGTVEGRVEEELDEQTVLLRKPFRVTELAQLAGRMLASARPTEIKT